MSGICVDSVLKVMLLQRPGNGYDIYSSCIGLEEHTGAFSHGAARGIDVIHQDYPLIPEQIGIADAECASDICDPLGGGKVDLRFGPANTPQIPAG